MTPSLAHRPTGVAFRFGATWPKRRPLARAARFDGVFPIREDPAEAITPEIVRDVVAFDSSPHESDAPFDFVFPMEGTDDLKRFLLRLTSAQPPAHPDRSRGCGSAPFSRHPQPPAHPDRSRGCGLTPFSRHPPYPLTQKMSKRTRHAPPRSRPSGGGPERK